MAVQDPGRRAGFPCKQRGAVCSSMSSLIDHMDGHLQQEERKFKCDECGRGYRHAGSLANHKKAHDVGSFQCNICGKENSNALALKSHLRSHTSQKKHFCGECGKAFRLASQLATHEKVHLSRRTKEQPYPKAGDVEYVTDESRPEIENHHLDKQSDNVGLSTEDDCAEEKSEIYNETCDDATNRPFKCDICDKSYIHHRSLVNHKKTHQVGMFECPVCFKLFNNMAALYSHQRTHKAKSGAELSSVGGVFTDTTALDHFSPQSQDAQMNFCHLCQVLFPNEQEFQEHIQMHNSSSLAFELQGNLPENRNISYADSISSPESNFYASHVNNGHHVSLLRNHTEYDVPHEPISNSNMYSDCSNSQTPSSSSTQGEAALDANVLTTASDHAHDQDEDSANGMEETSAVGSDERPFKCQICGKSYRHSGSLINHKRSHQVGIYQCSVCRKSYPHLAALKSHLRLHKGQTSSYSLNPEGDWLSSEPLTLDHQETCFSSQVGGGEQQEEEDVALSGLGIDQENGLDHSNGALYQQPFNQDFSDDMTAHHLPHDDRLLQRHMCADCGETFADIAGIKCHSCPLLQHHPSGDYGAELNFQDSNGHCGVGNPGSDMDFDGLNGIHDQSYFTGQDFHEDMDTEQLNSSSDADNVAEEDDDGDLYQCSICGNSYTSMRALRSHLRGHTQSHGTAASSGPSSMSSPEEAKEDEPGEMMICSTCGESFANRQDLTAHQLLHEEPRGDGVDPHHGDGSRCKEEAESIICGRCGAFSTSYHHLENHSCTSGGALESTNGKEEEEEEEEEEADVPGRGDTSPVKHAVDAGDRQYRCDQCGRSYRHAGSLLNHKKSHKTGVFRCLVCQKRFYNLLALKNHQRLHFDVKRHTCQECGKAFKIQKQLLNHLRRHRENQAKIQELNSQIQALMQMNGTKSAEGARRSPQTQAPASVRRCRQLPDRKAAQVKAEPGVKSEDTGDTGDRRPFACDQCGRTYRHAGSLVNHRNSHKTGDYCCSVCNNTYSNQLAMKNHLRTHFACKKHRCQNCGKGFRVRKQLLAHRCAELRKDGGSGRRGLRTRASKCRRCKTAFHSADQLAAHACEGSSCRRGAQTDPSQTKEERNFTCNICNRSYRHAGSLLNHKNTHKTGHFSCSFCSKPFTNPMALRNHTRIHTQKKKYVCLTCGKAFRLASILHNHQKVHNRVANHCSCSTCGKSFQGRAGLKRHRCQRGGGSAGGQHADSGDKCFMCDFCGRSYRHAGSLLNHKKTHSESLHHCTLCLQTFPDALTLQIHSQMRRHCCPDCGKTFCLVAHLQSHMEVHSKERAVTCALCQLSFPSAASYQQHRDTHHKAGGAYRRGGGSPCWDSGIEQTMSKQLPPPLAHVPGGGGAGGVDAEEKSHVCEHCGRTYRHAGSLLNHKNSHKTGSFFCSVCHKEFSNLMALKNHRRIHTEPKRYQCLECGKAFRVSTQLICHRRIHTKEKPFACLLCDKSFSTKSNLRHHQKMHQSNQSYGSFTADDDSGGGGGGGFTALDMGSFL